MTARRGAVLPLVCVLVVVLLTCAALALDIGRLYLTGAELQTAADAAALAATRAMQVQPTQMATAAPAAAVALGSANWAANRPAIVTTSDVRPKRYDATSNTFTDVAWSTANAVEVTARARPAYALAGAVGLAPPTVARQAASALGTGSYIVGMSCLRPMMISYTALYNQLFGTAYATGRAPDMTPAQMQAISSRTPTNRIFGAIPLNQTSSGFVTGTYGISGGWQSIGYAGPWVPLDFTNGAGTIATFTNWAQGVNCAAAQAAVGSSTVIVSKAGTLDALTSALSTVLVGASGPSVLGPPIGVCNTDFNNYLSVGLCLPAPYAPIPGVTVRVVLGDPSATTPGSRVTVRMVTTVQIMCYYNSGGTMQSCDDPNYPGGGWDAAYRYLPPPAGTFLFMLNAPFPGQLPATSDMAFGPGPMAPTVSGSGGTGGAGGTSPGMFLTR